MHLSTRLDENIVLFKELLPLGKSFDFISRELYINESRAYFMTINGMYRGEVLQQIFSELQNPPHMASPTVEDLQHFVSAQVGHAQVSLETDLETILRKLLSGPSVLLVDGFDRAIIIDVRSYPSRSMEEPDTEHVTQGARDGFVESLLFNTNLIRRRIRHTKLTFELTTVGNDSQTDIALAYVEGLADNELLEKIRQRLASLQISSLTMGSKSLEELLVHKHWFHPMPNIHSTERPDVACSYLLEGHVLLIVDNSPNVLILPCCLFQFTQSPADYCNSPLTGCYFRLVRFLCIPISLSLMPLFYLIASYYPQFALQIRLISSPAPSRLELTIFVFAAEFLLDLFKYSCTHSASRFSGSLSIIGGLIIGDVAVQLNWVSTEILFYTAITLLTTLSLASLELGNSMRIYRLFLLLCTACFGLMGFITGTALVMLSLVTTPTFGGVSYLWPLFPFHWRALKTLLLRYPTFREQPSKVWKR